jgi:deoxyribose-phosphate aldolase
VKVKASGRVRTFEACMDIFRAGAKRYIITTDFALSRRGGGATIMASNQRGQCPA